MKATQTIKSAVGSSNEIEISNVDQASGQKLEEIVIQLENTSPKTKESKNELKHGSSMKMSKSKPLMMKIDNGKNLLMKEGEEGEEGLRENGEQSLPVV